MNPNDEHNGPDDDRREDNLREDRPGRRVDGPDTSPADALYYHHWDEYDPGHEKGGPR